MKSHIILKNAGYNSRTVDNFGEIAKYAATLDGNILPNVVAKFGLPRTQLTMRQNAQPFKIWGNVGTDIDGGAVNQMATAMKLPVAVRGAMMPDSHLGYALNIGGVAELYNAISPSMIGYDISCMMKLTVIGGVELLAERPLLIEAMNAVTHFGRGAAVFADGDREHEVMGDSRWSQTNWLRQLKPLAQSQLGSSGSGNHFKNIMLIDGLYDEPVVGILTHSGSRGTGHKLATKYLQLAAKETRAIATGIPTGYEWLSLDTEAGLEYFMTMQLMGDYAQANHDLIHDHFVDYIGVEAGYTVSNRHNFAWLNESGGVVHRKGATPAEKGKIGLIPGSAGANSYIVRGLGNEESLCSSSHGAGRVSSRTKAKENFDLELVNMVKDDLGVIWIGVNKDENPFAYKDIEQVMALQSDLVEPIATMRPVIVKMGG